MMVALCVVAGAFANVPVVTSVIKPQKIVQTVSGGMRTYFIDFGPAYFGSISFSLTNSTASQSAEVVISEAASGSDVITAAVGARSSTATVTVTGGSKTYTSFIDQPIRAARIMVPDQIVSLDTSSVAVSAHHVPFNDSASTFTSSDTVLNRVYQLCKHTVKATSFLGVYIDGIRETKPYEGDTYINMLSHFAVDSNPPIALFSHEYLLTHPTWPWEYGLFPILVGWELYMANGNVDQLQRNYATLTGRIQSCIGSGSWSDSHSLVDWPANMRDNFDSTTRSSVVTNSWAYKALMTIADMADALNRGSEAAAYRSRAAQVKKRINDSLIIKEQGLYRDGLSTTHISLHSNLYPLAMGVVPDSLTKNVAQYLAKRGMVCNVYAAQFLLDGLFDAGFDSCAIALMAAKTGNSWGHMMYEVGSTITMEVWDPSQKPNLDWNHAWGAAPGNVIPRKLFGIMPLTPGYGKTAIKPRVGSLTSGRYSLPTVKGTITVAFESRRGQSMTITATIPSAMVAQVYVPTFGAANNDVLVDNKKMSGVRDGDFLSIDSISSGSHIITRSISTSSLPNISVRTATGRITIASTARGVCFRIGNTVPGPAIVTIFDCRGKQACRIALDATEDYGIALPTGAYVAFIQYPGVKAGPFRFIVQ